MATPAWRRVRGMALPAAALLAAGLVIVAVLFFLAGWRWFVVSTPSMGQSSPVGSLVLSEPVPASALHTGEVITFTPPGRPGTVYTHRIAGIDEAGGITTRGDINGTDDPWVLTPQNILGVATLLPGWGWLVKAVPLLLAGGLTVWAVTRYWIRGPWQGPVRLFGACAVVSLTVILLRPFIGLTLLGVTTDESGTRASVASTGLLPITVRAEHGTTAELSSGQVSELTATDGEGYYHLSSSADLPWWGWIITALLCLLPVFWVLGRGLRSGGPQETPARVPG
ncbi:signal peptidase I [Arthrobacter sp. UYNi723]